jgi:hypothetical protein
MTTDELRGRHWLFAYETARRQLIPGMGTAYVTNDPNFAWLLAHDVAFMKRFRKPSPRTLEEIRPPEAEYGQE